ncbi:hypothetical protein MC885_002451 [Smutsia gigantea]|nr:hypothetical protein MC885_002451 [Smutsia gigantea]
MVSTVDVGSFKATQCHVNELDGIPLILDSCSIDDILTQWAVYAIRNLTEDNSQNQDLIAKMEEQGLADASLLKKMGFEVEKRGDKLILKPTRDTPPLLQVLCHWLSGFSLPEFLSVRLMVSHNLPLSIIPALSQDFLLPLLWEERTQC